MQWFGVSDYKGSRRMCKNVAIIHIFNGHSVGHKNLSFSYSPTIENLVLLTKNKGEKGKKS